MKKTITLLSLLVSAAGLNAATKTIDFTGLEHGRIVNSQYAGDGLNISANGGPNLAVAFDSNLHLTRDADLQRIVDASDKANGAPDKAWALNDTNNGGWDSGNLAGSNPDLGNMLIIQENSTGKNDGIADSPDDRSAGGYITLTFDMPVFSFGFDLIDVETSESGYLRFYNSGTTVNTAFIGTGLVFGNNSANRIGTYTSFNGLDYFDKVEIYLSGSGAIDNVQYSYDVPDAANTIALLGASLIGLVAVRRRIRK